MFMVEKLAKRNAVTGFLLVLSLLLALANPMNPLVEWPRTLTDQSVFRTVAMVMQQGGMPYLDSFDHKGPLLFVYYYWGMNLSYNHGVWLFCWASLLITLVFMYRTARLWLARPQSCLVTAAGTLLTLGKFYEQGGLTEDFAMPYIAMALYFFLGYFQGRKLSAGKWFLLGWAFMSVALLRVNMVVPFLFFPPLIWLKEIWAGKGRLLIKPVLAFAAGLSLLGAFVAYWLWQGNALTACLADYIQFNLAYSADPERASLKNKIMSLVYFAKQPAILLSLVVLADRCLLTVKKWYSFDCMYVLYIILALLAICISGQQYGHYGMVLIPCTVYPLVLLLKGAAATISRQRLRVWLGLLMASMALMAVMPLTKQLYGYFKTGYNLRDVRADKDCANLLNEIVRRTDEQDRISVFGNDNIIYVASNRLPASVYSYQFPIANVDNRIGEKYFADLHNNRPKIIVVVRQKATAPIFSRWSKKMVDFLQTECYNEVYSNDKYIIYEQQGSGETDGRGI
ncbi:MAG: hypothetical protein K6F95_10195 [Selenomonas sp.]|uniref:ArnT family glycosyltransferase n=1 Tax=Selenomonas sp. TaxID=2053611 RepID=UPI0025F7FAD8|nr:hypothetical protein [Selenomonas sp.]MCR5758259.1 hypothetical protein [Selenomonas sp.]